ncbi:MAG TPA: hypothetical protein VKT32_00550 [Chthonomonadaceae bacterium]|nr:hypothetical protein [Chthonomonadaceae bacterium]
MLRRLLPLAGAAGATALFALMGAAPASAQSYFSIQYRQGYHRDYRDCDQGDVYVAPPRPDRDRYEHRDWNRDRDRDRGRDWNYDRGRDHGRNDHRHRR